MNNPNVKAVCPSELPCNPKYNTYIGARYVPVFAGEWNKNRTYEPLTIVEYQGNSYTSKTFVPIGADISDTKYWALTGNYNAQVEQYRKEVCELRQEFTILNGKIWKVVNVKTFGAVGDGVTDDTGAIQDAINSLVPGDVLNFENGAKYLVKKQFDQVLYPNNDAPCLFFINKDNIEINGNGATLISNVHGQGIIELMECDNVHVYDLNLKGFGQFPKIDPDSGLGEKGNSKGGYYDGKNDFPWFKNNAIDTTGYRGFGKDPNAIWGGFGGGYIGSAGDGILIYNGCSNILIENCSAFGFNYSAFQVGLRLHPWLGNTNITFKNCLAYDCYDSGFNIEQCSVISVENCKAYRLGHPSAFPGSDHIYKYPEADPGYGITLRKGPYRPINVSIKNNYFENLIRKGIDSHCGQKILIDGNQINLCYFGGIDITADAEAHLMTEDLIITNNIIENCGFAGGSGINVIQRESSSINPSNYATNYIIDNNILKKCGGQGFLRVAACKSAIITNNIINSTMDNLPTTYPWTGGTRVDTPLWIGGDMYQSKYIVKNNHISVVNDKAHEYRGVIWATRCTNSEISGNFGEITFGQYPFRIENSTFTRIYENKFSATTTGSSLMLPGSNTNTVYLYKNDISRLVSEGYNSDVYYNDLFPLRLQTDTVTIQQIFNAVPLFTNLNINIPVESESNPAFPHSGLLSARKFNPTMMNLTLYSQDGKVYMALYRNETPTVVTWREITFAS